MRILGTVALAAAMTFVVSGALAEGDVPDGRSYVCDEGMPYVQVVFNQDGATLMLESEQIPMAEVPVASGFGYDVVLPAGHFMVQGQGNDVTLYVDDQAPKTCFSRDDDGGSYDAETADTGYVSQMGNYSLGGKLRAGPGMSYESVGSLPYGTPIAIVRHTGEWMDGYEWFQIEWDTNRAFQWGGIMCSNALHIMGVYDPCPDDLD